MPRADFPPSVADAIRELSAEAKEEAAAFKSRAEEATRRHAVWESLNSFINKGWSLHILELLEREAPQVKELEQREHAAAQAIGQASTLAAKIASRFHVEFPREIEEASQEAHLRIDKVSRHPTYYFDEQFFRLEIDEGRKSARLYTNEGKLAEHPADAGAIVETLQRERHRILDRPFNSKTFLRKLRHHYSAIIKKERREDGEAIPIRRITGRLGKNQKGFRTDEFLYDLARLVEEASLTTDGWELDLQHTKDTREGMLLHGVARRGYIGFIVFRKI